MAAAAASSGGTTTTKRGPPPLPWSLPRSASVSAPGRAPGMSGAEWLPTGDSVLSPTTANTILRDIEIVRQARSSKVTRRVAALEQGIKDRDEAYVKKEAELTALVQQSHATLRALTAKFDELQSAHDKRVSQLEDAQRKLEEALRKAGDRQRETDEWIKVVYNRHTHPLSGAAAAGQTGVPVVVPS